MADKPKYQYLDGTPVSQEEWERVNREGWQGIDPEYKLRPGESANEWRLRVFGKPTDPVPEPPTGTEESAPSSFEVGEKPSAPGDR